MIDHVVQYIADVLQALNEVGGGWVLDNGGEGLGEGLLVGWWGDVGDYRGFG